MNNTIKVISFTLLAMCFAILGFKHFRSTGDTAQAEGFGVNRSSRRYFEYLRNHDPISGIYNPSMRKASVEYVSRLPRNADRSLDWQARGPFNKGGRTRALAIDILDENHILAGAVTGGVWSSSNAGQSWAKTTAPGQIHAVSSLVQDVRPGHENTWYQGTGEESYGVVSGTSFTSLFSGDGIMKSTDNGQTWFSLTSTSSGTPQSTLQFGSYDFVWNLAVDHTNAEEDVLYAAVYSGIIRSSDGGDTWTQVLGFGSAGQEFSDIMITPAGVLYACLSYTNPTNKGGYFRSTDGINWTNITPTAISSQRRTVMCANPQNENDIYFLTEIIGTPLSSVGHTLFKYTYLTGDGSGSDGLWNDRSTNLPDDACELFIGDDFDFGTWRSQFSYDMCMTHHPTEPDVLFIGGINIHRSNTAFAQDDHSWIGGYRCNPDNPVSYSYPNHHSDEHLMVFSRTNSNVMYSANDGGVYKTDNAMAANVEWIPLNNGYQTTQFYTVGMEQGQSESDFVFGGMQDNGTWITNNTVVGQTWKEVHADDGSYGAIPFGRDFVISSSQSGRIYKKKIDANGQLTGTKRIDPDQGPAQLFINPLLLDPLNSNDLYIAGNRTIWWMPNVSAVEVTQDYLNELPNDFWVNMSSSIIPVSHGSISCLDKALGDNTVIYYGTTVGKLWKLTDCYGTTPVKTNISGTNFPAGAYTSCVTINDFNTDEAIVSFSNYNIPSIFHTTDGGVSWQDVSGNLEENTDGTGAGPAVYWVEIYPGETAKYFAGTSAGLFSTDALDGANTVWEMEGANTIGNVIINMVKVRPYDGKIVVGTHGNGVYSSQMDPVVAASVSNQNSNIKSNVPPFPNPFIDRITFTTTVVSAGIVNVEIFDVNGVRVDAIDFKTNKSGTQKINWNPKADLPKGTYLYKIKSEGAVSSGKIIRQ